MTSARPLVDHEPSSLARLSVGVAQADITPPVGISSNPWGKSTSAISTGVHRPLMAVALCIRGESDKFIVTLDLGWIGCHECDVVKFRGRVVKELGIGIDDLLVNLSQTHKGPPMCVHEALREGKELVPDFIEKVISTVAEICKKARSGVALADITWAYGKCDLGTVRDLPIGDTDVVGYNPELKPDDTLVVGRVRELSGKHVATLVNFGCHPTSVGWDSPLISPDYIGRARELVENETGAPMLFLLGACGNVAPRRQYSGDVSIADSNGEMLGYSTLATLSRMLPPATELAFTEVIKSGSNLAGWEPRSVIPNSTLITTRVDALLKHKELLDENQHANTIIVYQYQEELAELKRRFNPTTLDDGRAIERWNAGQVRLLAVHPKSAGHGLNLQHGGCHMVFLSLPWSLELYEQTIGRLHRSGQAHAVWCYVMLTNTTVDEKIFAALHDKRAVSDIAMEELK